MIKKHTFVQIYRVILPQSERSDNLPKDTKEVPFEIRMKGILLEDANIGDYCTIETGTKRIEKGILIKEHPYYEHSFGHYVDALTVVRKTILQETEDIK